MSRADAPWGVMAEFATAEQLLAAAHAVRAQGYTRLEAYSPFPVEGLHDTLGHRPTHVPAVTFAGGLLGGAGGYFMQWYSAVIDYPLNIGGRPLHSWPMFVPVAFELAVLGAALAAFGAVLIGNRLPDLAAPVFHTPDIDAATRNRFFLCLRSDDAQFDAAATAALVDSLQPMRRSEVRV
ncbi:DUF3341 domain-containing protein [Rhizobacter fulvus]